MYFLCLSQFHFALKIITITVFILFLDVVDVIMATVLPQMSSPPQYQTLQQYNLQLFKADIVTLFNALRDKPALNIRHCYCAKYQALLLNLFNINYIDRVLVVLRCAEDMVLENPSAFPISVEVDWIFPMRNMTVHIWLSSHSMR